MKLRGCELKVLAGSDVALWIENLLLLNGGIGPVRNAAVVARLV